MKAEQLRRTLDVLIEGGYIQLRERPFRVGEQTFQGAAPGAAWSRMRLAGGEELPAYAQSEGEATL